MKLQSNCRASIHGVLLVGLVVGITVAPAAAQQLKLEIKNGRVNLEASAVHVREILVEWARVGGTRVVDGDRVTGPHVTLRLIDAPEREALAIILRDVAGYIATPRSVSDLAGPSTYDRLLIVANSATRPATAAARPGMPPNPTLISDGESSAPLVEEMDRVGEETMGNYAAEGQEAAQSRLPPHAPLPVPPNSVIGQPVQGQVGRRADPGMVPVTIPEPAPPAKPTPVTFAPVGGAIPGTNR
jgi:hypothetical protein